MTERAPLDEMVGLAEAIAEVDAADAACPVRNGRSAYRAVCPKCGANTSQGCGPIEEASYRVVTQARALIARAKDEEGKDG
jgi:hypothetical protein